MPNLQHTQLFIRGDLNDLHDGIISLRNTVWIALLKKYYGEHLNGQHIWLYERTGKDPNGDPWVFPGLVRETGGGQYEIVVDEKDFKRLSEVKEFKGYAPDDLGSEFADEYERQFGTSIDIFKQLKLSPSAYADFSKMKEEEYIAIHAHEGRKMLAQVSLILFDYDFVGLNFDTNFDEYEGEARLIIKRASDAADILQLAAIIKDVFADQFDPKTADRITDDGYLAAAKDIWPLVSPKGE